MTAASASTSAPDTPSSAPSAQLDDAPAMTVAAVNETVANSATALSNDTDTKQLGQSLESERG